MSPRRSNINAVSCSKAETDTIINGLDKMQFRNSLLVFVTPTDKHEQPSEVIVLKVRLTHVVFNDKRVSQ